MGHYLTNAALKAAGPPAVRPRVWSLYAEKDSELVQEVFEERNAEQPVAAPAPRSTPLPAPQLQALHPNPASSDRDKPERKGQPEAESAPLFHEQDASASTIAQEQGRQESYKVHPRGTTRPIAGLLNQTLSEPGGGTAGASKPGAQIADERHPSAEEQTDERRSVARHLPGNEVRPPSSKAGLPASEELEPAAPWLSDAADPPVPAESARRTPVVRLVESRSEAGDDGEATQPIPMAGPSPRVKQPETMRSRPQVRKSASAAERTAEPERTVEISIGRIEIHATTPSQAAQKRGAAAPSSRSSLEVYLEKVRAGGRT
jgi:hypothetical protein